MQATAQHEIALLAARPFSVDLIYLAPLGDWSAFEAALFSMVSRFVGRVRLVRATSTQLCRLTSARVFLSKAVPNIIVLRKGEVVAHAVGALPMTELKAILTGAIQCAA
jgi:hypothetical protein